MQLSEFEVVGLFGRYHHQIKFPAAKPDDPRPSLVILHGPNGVGKTTILRMIDGFMRLDFDPFRQNPFRSAALRFSNGSCLQVKAVTKGKKTISLEVDFDGTLASLHPAHSGALKEADNPKINAFRQKFFTARKSLVFEFIDTTRIVRQRPPDDEDIARARALEQFLVLREKERVNPKALAPTERLTLAERVTRFIDEAQVNHRRFFAVSETDLFSQILQKLTAAGSAKLEAEPLLDRLKIIGEKDYRFKRFGIGVDVWDLAKIKLLMKKADKGIARDQAIVALSAFVEILESRTAERSLLADRLETFIRVTQGFFEDKRVVIMRKDGLIIRTKPPERRTLTEQQLSTGEFHLLYLLVAALVTQRRGTVIAIDEPEMSMHLAWQRKLIRALVECASKAEPQLIFATHSPDIAADYPEALVEVGKKQ